MTSNVKTANLKVGAGYLYMGVTGAVEPVGLVAPDAAVWTPVGATSGGIKVTIQNGFNDFNIDQLVWSPGAYPTSQGATVETSFAEVTHKNLQYVLNGGTIASATGVDTFSPLVVAPGAAPTYAALLFDIPGAGGTVAERWIFRKVLSTNDVEMDSKKDAENLFSVTFEAYWVDDSTVPFVRLAPTPV